MTLTLSHGPLSGDARPGNYRIDGPEHLLLFDEFPRRVRAVFAGVTVLDTADGRLLHETGLLPQLYVPEEDLDTAILQPSRHRTHCPFKGEATYWSITAGGRTAADAVWAYDSPKPGTEWLAGHRAVAWSAADAWFDEDEQVQGHLRDPYHRVDVRRTSRRVQVRAGDDIVAETDRALVLSETGLPNRYYLPADTVRPGVLERSATVTVCPYKGTTVYWSLHLAGRTIPDAAWTYPEPFDGVRAIAGHVCFAHDELTVEAGRG